MGSTKIDVDALIQEGNLTKLAGAFERLNKVACELELRAAEARGNVNRVFDKMREIMQPPKPVEVKSDLELEENGDEERTPFPQQVINVLRSQRAPMSLMEISKSFPEKTYNHVSTTLRRLKENGSISSPSRGFWSMSPGLDRQERAGQLDKSITGAG